MLRTIIHGLRFILPSQLVLLLSFNSFSWFFFFSFLERIHFSAIDDAETRTGISGNKKCHFAQFRICITITNSNLIRLNRCPWISYPFNLLKLSFGGSRWRGRRKKKRSLITTSGKISFENFARKCRIVPNYFSFLYFFFLFLDTD